MPTPSRFAAVALFTITPILTGCQNAGEKAADAKDAVVARVSPSGAASATGMRGTLEGLVQHALESDALKKLADSMSASDRQAIEKANINTSELDEAVKVFKKHWHAKHNNDAFRVMAADQVYSESFVTFWASESTAAERKVGKATIKASHGLPQLELPMVAEGGNWRLDLPDNVTPQALYDALLATVRDLNNSPGVWPENENESYQYVSHRVLLAVMGRAGRGS